ncbi:MAG: hypothetical protein N2A99_06475 [Carnobacterium alterfunditum]
MLIVTGSFAIMIVYLLINNQTIERKHEKLLRKLESKYIANKLSLSYLVAEEEKNQEQIKRKETENELLTVILSEIK